MLFSTGSWSQFVVLYEASIELQRLQKGSRRAIPYGDECVSANVLGNAHSLIQVDSIKPASTADFQGS